MKISKILSIKVVAKKISAKLTDLINLSLLSSLNFLKSLQDGHSSPITDVKKSNSNCPQFEIDM